MQFRFELEGGNFSKAGYASSQIKKVLKQLSVDPRIIKRVVVALYEAEVNVVAHAWRGTVLADIEVDRISLLLQDEGPAFPISDRPCRKVSPPHRQPSARWGSVQAWGCPI